MLNIILDTNIILRHPKVLGLVIPNIKFLIPSDVIEELNSRANLRGVAFDTRIELVQKASDQGTIIIVNTDSSIYQQFLKKFKTSNLSKTDLNILALAVDFKMKEQGVKIATNDSEIIRFARSNGIETLDSPEIEILISNFQSRKNKGLSNLQKEISSYEISEYKSFIAGISIGVIVTIISFLIFKNITKIVATINVWGTIALILLTGICLFLFREWKRLSYGVLEFLAGASAIIILFQSKMFDFSKVDFNIEFTLKILGGLYIMVRGLDNIIKSIKDTKMGLYLKEKYKIGA